MNKELNKKLARMICRSGILPSRCERKAMGIGSKMGCIRYVADNCWNVTTRYFNKWGDRTFVTVKIDEPWNPSDEEPKETRNADIQP